MLHGQTAGRRVYLTKRELERTNNATSRREEPPIAARIDSQPKIKATEKEREEQPRAVAVDLLLALV